MAAPMVATAVACAAAVATIHVIQEENLIENAANMGELLTTGLRKLQEEHPEIGDVRGWGLMIGTEFSTADGKPWGEKAAAVAKVCRENDLLLLTCGAYGNVVRWIPPLVTNQVQMQEALDIFAAALKVGKQE